MDREQFAACCPGALWFGPAQLPEHALTVVQPGVVTPVASTGDTIWGVLWLVPFEEILALEQSPRMKSGEFRRGSLPVISPAGPRTEANVYHSGNHVEFALDAKGYTDLQTAAKSAGLPDAYRKRLLELPVLS